MFRSLIAAAFCLAAGCAGMGRQDLMANGLDGFTRTADANWTFANGTAQADKGSGPSLLLTRESFKDFELSLEVYVSVEHNSGVFIRCTDMTNVLASNCYEINIFDKRPDQSGRTGGAPGFFKPLAQVDAGGKWTKVVIRAVGPHIKATFDGVVTIDNDGPLLSESPIGLQWGAGEVKFRNVRIRRLAR
jgi:hypothetical protein